MPSGRGVGGCRFRASTKSGPGKAGARSLSGNVSFTRRALHDLKRLDKPTRKRIVKAIEHYLRTREGDVKRLKGQVRKVWRLRIGDWRVLYTPGAAGTGVVVVRVVHRSQAYRHE